MLTGQHRLGVRHPTPVASLGPGPGMSSCSTLKVGPSVCPHAVQALPQSENTFYRDSKRSYLTLLGQNCSRSPNPAEIPTNPSGLILRSWGLS
jgi:hypothetical protein